MISKRRKTLLRVRRLNRHSKHCSNRRSNRFQMRGGLDNIIHISEFKKNLVGENSFHYVTFNQLKIRNAELVNYKANLDAAVLANGGKYTPALFNQYITNPIGLSDTFKQCLFHRPAGNYSEKYNESRGTIGPSIYLPEETKIKPMNWTIYPRIKDYLNVNVGFTIEQLLLVELSYTDFGVSTNIYDNSLPIIVKKYTVEDMLNSKFPSVNDILQRDTQRIDLLTKFKADGFTASQLKVMGFSSAERLKLCGFSANDIINAGFELHELLKTPNLFTLQELITLKNEPKFKISLLFGYFPKNLNEIINSGASIPDLKSGGINAGQLRGKLTAEKLLGIYTATELKAGGFRANELKAGGFSIKDLRDAMFTAQELKDADADVIDVTKKQFPLKALIALREISPEFVGKGYDNRHTNTTGYPLMHLINAGYDLIRDTDCNLIHIFESKKYTYGEIMEAFKYYNDRKGFNLTPIDTKIKKMKETCRRTGGYMGMAKETPLNCVYGDI